MKVYLICEGYDATPHLAFSSREKAEAWMAENLAPGHDYFFLEMTLDDCPEGKK